MSKEVYPLWSPQRVAEDSDSMLLLDRQFRYYGNSARYRTLKSSMSVNTVSPNDQLFYREGRQIYERTLVDLGVTKPSSSATKQSEKEYLSEDIMKAISEMETVSDYRHLDVSKGKYAIRVEDVDYEISITSHREKQVEFDGKVVLEGKPKPHVFELGDKLAEKRHKIVRLKTNLITIENEREEQISVKLTRKRKHIF